MSKFACICGHVINLSQGTSESEYSLVPETTIDAIGGILSTRGLSEEGFYDAINDGASTVYRCSKCGRLHLDEGGGVFSSYVKEESVQR
ncbi:hypothetical protein PS655_04908 [Pseudomonas fluorescens]|uniref:Uncharacterized protein n=1 Tax=Pseudomonas fluorescens TaxID=294 RepID=A0A5E6WUP6_PSEFL|nr:hypothetical protein PS655_04908 [Pseudomonas fluorescens]